MADDTQRQWREKQAEEIKARDEASKAKRQETIGKAERAIDQFYEEYAAKKERNIRENKYVPSLSPLHTLVLTCSPQGARGGVSRRPQCVTLSGHHLAAHLLPHRAGELAEQDHCALGPELDRPHALQGGPAPSEARGRCCAGRSWLLVVAGCVSCISDWTTLHTLL